MTNSVMMPQTYSELERWAAKVASTDFCPKEYRGKPNDVLICAQYATELGLGIVEGLRSIAVINGKPSLYGDGLLALCQRSPVCEYIKETPILENGIVTGYICEAKRRGEDAKVSRFTLDDAKRAKLAGKAGPWQEYPQRMLQMRARGFALRDAFADLLRGVITREEAMDYPQERIELSNVKPVKAGAAPRVAAPQVDEISENDEEYPNKEKEAVPTPEEIIAAMQECSRVAVLRDYGLLMKPAYDKFSEADRERINTEYKRLMKVFAEGGS